MIKFVKLIQMGEGGAYLKSWVPTATIEKFTQNSVTQEGDTRATCVFKDGTTVDLISFNETLDFLK